MYRWNNLRNCCYRVLLTRNYCKAAGDKEMVLDSLYTDEEKRNILECFNKSSIMELMATKNLNKQKSSSVVSHREKFGEFTCLTDISKVPGFGLIALQKLCNILKRVTHEQLKESVHKMTAEVVKSQPNLSKEKCKSIQNIVAMDIQADRITWLKMSRDLHVDDWQQVKIFNKPYVKYEPAVYIEKMTEVVNNLPSAGIYTLENKIYRYPSLRVVPFVFNLRIIEAMLVSMLNKNFNTDCTHRVYTIKPQAISKLFNLSIGGERVSGQHIFRDIINKKSDPDLGVTMSNHLSSQFFQYDGIQQEKITCCLLQALTFYKLIILKE